MFGIVLLTVVTRLPALVHPQAIDDEETYSVVGNVIVDGGRPYVDAVERKPPLLFWTYAAVVEAAGKYNWKALHAVRPGVDAGDDGRSVCDRSRAVRSRVPG